MDEFAPADPFGMEGGATDEPVQENPADKYWATLGMNVQDPALAESERRMLADHIHKDQDAYFEAARARGFLGMWIVSYAAWHGLDPDSMSTFRTQQLGFDGEQLEFLRICINIWRTYIQRQVTQVLSQDMVLKARATNNDVSSKLEAQLSDDIVQGLAKRATGGQKLRDMEIIAGFSGASFGHLRWDQHGGDIVTVGQQQVSLPDGTPAMMPVKGRSGQPRLTACYPWNVFQVPEEEEQTLWRAVRVNDNRHNLAATYAQNDPELRKKILAENTDDLYSFDSLFGFEGFSVRNDDACTTIHWYHAPSAALPQGRYVILLGSIVLFDAECPVSENTPITELCPARFIMTKFGYAPAWDLLSIQQALNQIVSDELSNIATGGRQSIAMEKGTEIVAADIVKGNRGYFYPQGGKPPQAVLMNDIGTGPSILKQYLHKMLDDVSGQNAAARGDPDASVKSGTFAALLHTITIEYQSYVIYETKICWETIGNQCVEMQRKFGGDTPFMGELVGIDNRTYLKEYTSQDLEGFRGAVVEDVPLMLQSWAGRLDMHEHLKDYAPEDRSAAWEFIATGRSDAFMRADRNAKLYIDRENELLITGAGPVQVGDIDDPFKHFPEHRACLDGMYASANPDFAAIERMKMHLTEHSAGYMNLHPLVCGFLQIPPPPPVLGNPAFEFAASIAQAQMMLAQMSGGMPADPNAQPPAQKQKPQPGEPGSLRPGNGKSGKTQLSAGEDAAPASQPGGNGRDNSGVKLPKPAQPPQEQGPQQ